MPRTQVNFIFTNIGHFLDHFFMLIFASVAALRLTQEWGMEYSELIPYATPGFLAFGTCSLVAGWLADKWSRRGMMAIFFLGIGVSSLASSFADTPLQIAISLFFIGVFSAIYHPVGLAMVVDGREKTGTPLAINGVFGNMGVASAALVTGLLIDTYGWRSAFYLPGIVSIVIGVLYLVFIRQTSGPAANEQLANKKSPAAKVEIHRSVAIRAFGVIFFTTALGGLIFQSTTFSLPKIFEETLTGSATVIGWYAFLVFSVAAFAQLAVGYLVDHFSVRAVFTTVAAMQCILFGVMTQVSGIAALLVAIGFMLFVFGQIPINDVLVARMVKPEWRSRAYAARYLVTFSVMALSLPFIAWVHGHWGFVRLFTVLGVAALFIFVATLFLPAKANQAKLNQQ